MNFKTLFVITIVLGLSLNAISQKDSTDFIKNNIYAEFGGIGGYGSINYERLIDKKSYFKVFGRIGLSTYNLKDYQNNFNPDIIVPLAMNACLGNEHNLELGLGPTFSRIVKVQENQGEWLDFNFNVGYRYQKESGGVLIRCGYTPVLENNNTGSATWRHWAGVSIGYAF